MNSFTKPVPPKRKVWGSFDPETQTVTKEGECLSCPFCGDELAWTKGKSAPSTRYVLASGVWILPAKGASRLKPMNQRRDARRQKMREAIAAGVTEEQAMKDARALKALEKETRGRIVRDARTGEATRLAAKGGTIQQVAEAGVFQCAKCEALVKIERSDN